MTDSKLAEGPPTLRNSTTTREEWLTVVVEAMGAWFAALGHPLPVLRISEGFPSTGQRGREVTEAWSDDEGASFTIVVRPDFTDPARLAAGLAYRMAQIAAGSAADNRRIFRHIAISIGLSGRRVESAPKALFRELVRPVLGAAGPLPPPKATLSSSNSRGKQSSRLLKVSCPQCGYVVRVARKWLVDRGPPHCPDHGAMRQDV